LSFRYWHLQCAARSLANELGQALAAYPGPIDDRPSLEALVAQHARPPMPFAERANTGRARCRACEENIAKGALRVVFERTYETPIGPQKAAAYAHARCLARYRAREKERARTPPSADAPSAPPAGGRTLDDLLVQVRSNSKLAEEDLTAVENEARAGSV
jgi:hypothetical protein